jgi:hypothetical protein
MSTVNQSGKKEKSKVFEMVLSSPGMSENCKISFKMTRQNVLVLGRLIEAGVLESKNLFEDEILGVLPAESAAEFKIIHEEILKKAGLTDFYEKMKSL